MLKRYSKDNIYWVPVDTEDFRAYIQADMASKNGLVAIRNSLDRVIANYDNFAKANNGKHLYEEKAFWCKLKVKRNGIGFWARLKFLFTGK